jgi:quercetin dioxygenase-like cupin family protein
MHSTDTVDIALVLCGEVVLELEGGASTRLRAGDFVVQNGTAHAWSNDTEMPCRILFVLCGATTL